MKKREIMAGLLIGSAVLAGNDPANAPMKIETLHPVEVFPELSNRKAWKNLEKRKDVKEFRDKIIVEAEQLLQEPILELPASKFMEFQLNGNRKHFEVVYFERRRRLATLFLAEAFEYKDRFTVRLIDEIWAILNEPTWCIPAHRTNGYRIQAEVPPGKPDPLAWFDYEVVDLFSAQTSAIMSCVYRMSKKELGEVSPGLVRRLRETIHRRTIRALSEMSYYHWTAGWGNWTPWICSNLLLAANNIADGDPKDLTILAKLYLQIYMDRYMSQYPADGGCNEGPSYWAVSVGRAMSYYELLYRMSDEKCSLYQSPKFVRMAEYIANSMFGPNAMACFADCPPKPGNFPAGSVTKFAERTGNEKLLTLCHAYRKEIPLKIGTRGTSLVVQLENLFYEKDGSGEICDNFSFWYEGLQQLFVHSGRLGFAAKAGTNREGHNHNDVGQFILAADGEIFLADVGNSEYTKNTFGAHRYENPIINFEYHNAPVFDGIGEQKDVSRKEAARNVKVEEKGDVIILTMDIVEFYPKELELLSCKRTFELNRKEKSLTVTDEWKSKKPHVFSMTLFTTAEWGKGPYAVSATLPVKSSRFKITDINMKQNWKVLWMNTVKSGRKASSGKHVLKFKLQEKGKQNAEKSASCKSGVHSERV